MKETILIAEDDADIRDLLRLYLESEGFSVIEACDGEEAMRKANSAAPDLAILDVMMPRMNGLETTKALRRVSAIPILILSARSTDNDKILGLNLGADDYIAKPFNPMEVVARVKAQLRRAGRGGDLLTVGDLTLDVARCGCAGAASRSPSRRRSIKSSLCSCGRRGASLRKRSCTRVLPENILRAATTP